MSKLERPREIIEFCLKPFNVPETAEAYKEAFHRLEHVIKTFQLAAIKAEPVAVDFSTMKTITINESAHGDGS
jgi:hypothetical protein